MPTFGFSAFLKLLLLSPRRQKGELRKRLRASDSAYDFHRSLRLRANKYLVGNQSLTAILDSTAQIARIPERTSATHALRQLGTWRDLNPGPIVTLPSATYESPRSLFKVKFSADFGLMDGRIAIHIWNTAKPDLQLREIYTALSLFPNTYAGVENAPNDFAVLSLKRLHLYRLSDASDFSLIGRRTVEVLESLFEEVTAEIGVPEGDRPSVPPPAQ